MASSEEKELAKYDLEQVNLAFKKIEAKKRTLIANKSKADRKAVQSAIKAIDIKINYIYQPLKEFKSFSQRTEEENKAYRSMKEKMDQNAEPLQAERERLESETKNWENNPEVEKLTAQLADLEEAKKEYQAIMDGKPLRKAELEDNNSENSKLPEIPESYEEALNDEELDEPLPPPLEPHPDDVIPPPPPELDDEGDPIPPPPSEPPPNVEPDEEPELPPPPPGFLKEAAVEPEKPVLNISLSTADPKKSAAELPAAPVTASPDYKDIINKLVKSDNDISTRPRSHAFIGNIKTGVESGADLKEKYRIQEVDNKFQTAETTEEAAIATVVAMFAAHPNKPVQISGGTLEQRLAACETAKELGVKIHCDLSGAKNNSELQSRVKALGDSLVQPHSPASFASFTKSWMRQGVAHQEARQQLANSPRPEDPIPITMRK